MLPHDKALALSPVDVELARDMRSRLNRRAPSDAAQLALGAAFGQACARLGIAAADGLGPEVSPGALATAAATADMKTLARLTATLRDHRTATPQTWPAIVAAGAPQAILSRRLALAGREPALEL